MNRCLSPYNKFIILNYILAIVLSYIHFLIQVTFVPFLNTSCMSKVPSEKKNIPDIMGQLHFIVACAL